MKRQILASRIALKRSQNNEAALQKELSRFFKRLSDDVQFRLETYWSDYQLVLGQIDLMTAPIDDAFDEYCEILEQYIRKEYL